MHSNTLKTIGQVLSMHDIAPNIQKAVITELGKIRHAKGDMTEEEAQWALLLHTLRAERRAMTTNLHNRSENLREVYTEYIGIMDRVIDSIERAAQHGTLPQAGAKAALVNKDRALEGKRPLGTNGTRWQSWVPPHIRESFALKVEQAYVTMGYRSGNRFVPFVPPALRKELKLREANMRTALRRIKERNEDFPGSGTGYTYFRALYLAAARMAERSLNKMVQGYTMGAANPFDTPLPVNWLALLDAPMRARLRKAQENPAAVDPTGLDQFYNPPPENVAIDAAHRDMELLGKYAADLEQMGPEESGVPSVRNLTDIEFDE